MKNILIAATLILGVISSESLLARGRAHGGFEGSAVVGKDVNTSVRSGEFNGRNGWWGGGGNGVECAGAIVNGACVPN